MKANPGFYPDPSGRFPLRFFDGDRWTADVWDGLPSSMAAIDPLPPRPPSGSGAPLWYPACTAAPPPPAPPPRHAIRTWWHDTWRALSADLAVNGLAYLGVLLVFVGVFGFVAFAFGDVSEAWRPVAEAVLPAVCFAAAWMLRRRHTMVVANALELLGGALVPIVVIASFNDGAAVPVPPDPQGGALVAAIVTSLLGVALVYIGVVRWRATSPLRFLIAPVMWLAVAAIGLFFAPVVPSGPAIARPIPAQWALVAVAVMLTAVVVRVAGRRDAGFAGALLEGTRRVLLPGVIVAEVLMASAAATSEWPPAAVVLGGMASFAVFEVWAHELRRGAVLVGQTAVLAATLVGLAPTVGAPWTGALAALAGPALLEWTAWRRRDALNDLGVALLAAASVTGMLVAVASAEWPAAAAVVAFGGPWLWRVARRLAPVRDPLPGGIGAVAVAALPLGFGATLVAQAGVADAALVLAPVAAVLAVVVRLVPGAVDDDLWALVVPGGAAAIALVLIDWPPQYEAPPPSVAAAWLLLAVTFAAAPRWLPVRMTAAAGALAGAAASFGLTYGLSARWTTIGLATLSVVAAILVTRSTHLRPYLLAVHSVAGVGAVASGVIWYGATASELAVLLPAVAGALALVLALLAAEGWPRRDWLAAWAPAVPVGLVAGAAAFIDRGVPDTPGIWALTAALGAVALAAGTVAEALDVPVGRDLAVGAGAAAVGAPLLVFSPPATTVVWVSGVAGTVAAILLSLAHVGGPGIEATARRWVRPGVEAMVLAAGVSTSVALATLPARPPLVGALLLLGLDLLALGVVGRHPAALEAAPLPMGAAWLLFASEALTGNPQWFTVPIGLALLAAVGAFRVQERREGHDPATLPVIVLDVLGSALLVGSAVVQIVVDDIAYGALATGLGLGILGWGVLTHVRRRVTFGAGTVAVALALMVLVPLLGVVPEMGGIVLWASIAGVGLLAIAAAAFVERGRASVHRLRVRFLDVTREWEGWRPHHPPSLPA